MASIAVWTGDNWFSLLQSLGIIFGLVLTAFALRRDTRERKLSNFLVVADQHRELWSALHERPDLQRIRQPQVDLVAAPISPAEEEFLNVAIVHFHTGWLLVREGSMTAMASVSGDIRGFFSLPLPRAVWNQTKGTRDPEFVMFVEESIK